MPTTYKVLGRKASAATTMEELYAVPSTTSAVVSTITVCNRSASARTYRIAIKPATGTTLADEHYIAYDVTIAAKVVGSPRPPQLLVLVPSNLTPPVPTTI